MSAVSPAWAAPHDEEDFWNARPVLRSIRANAYRTTTAPWALLGGAILRAIQDIPPHVMYASYLGRTGLNLGAVLLGASGTGKSVLSRTLDDALPVIGPFGQVERFRAIEVGSGEAISEQYAIHSTAEDADADGLIWHAKSLGFGFDEVGRLTAMKGRTGSTVLEYVKTAISGGSLGRRLAGRGGVELPSDSYRFTVTINAQPARTAVLLNADEIAGGLPGRLLWFSTVDRDMRSRFDRSPVEPFKLRAIDWTNVQKIDALPEMNAAHAEDRISAHERDRADLDGHRLLARAKVAIALMRLDERIHLIPEDWLLADEVMHHSDGTRDTAIYSLQQAERTEAAERGKREGVRAAIADQERDRRMLENTRLRLHEVIAKGENPLAKRNYNTSQREYMDTVLAEAGLIEA